MKGKIFFSLVTLTAITGFSQGRDAFASQQAYAEMQKVAGQMDVLSSNIDDLQRRVGRLEGGNKSDSLRAEVDALRGAIAELRREIANQRSEIVRELTGKIATIQAKSTPQPAPTRKVVVKPAYNGPCSEYVVQNGDTLSLIAQAFNTKVDTLKSMNNLKKNNLRVGQKLLVPKVK